MHLLPQAQTDQQHLGQTRPGESFTLDIDAGGFDQRGTWEIVFEPKYANYKVVLNFSATEDLLDKLVISFKIG